MKQAIKSGRIPMSRLKEILARRKAGAKAPMVDVQQVAKKPINAFLILNGTVEPERQVAVHSRLAAYVKNIVREEGDIVKKNDLLALLDDTEIAISHKQAKIQLEQAQLTLKDEEANYKRSQELHKTAMISQQDYQDAESNYNKAQLEYKTKTENFKDLQLQLNYTRITAPVSGYVTQRMLEVGARVTANQQVYTVEDFNPLLIKVYVPTSDMINLEKGMKTEITTTVLEGITFNGSVKLINPRIDVNSGTVKVTVEVFDKSGKLKPGMFVETRILVRNKPDALVVPKKAVRHKGDQTFVFVFKRMKATKRLVQTGIIEGDFIEIHDGLEAGQRVVTVGVEGLKDGMTVKLKDGMGGRFARGEGKPGIKGEPEPRPGGDHPPKDRRKKRNKDRKPGDKTDKEINKNQKG